MTVSNVCSAKCEYRDSYNTKNKCKGHINNDGSTAAGNSTFAYAAMRVTVQI